jgi:tight adherence protein C
MSAPLAWAVLCGTGLGLGLWSIVSVMPRLSRPSLASRLAPYLLDVSAEARTLMGRTSVDPIPVLGTLFAPAFTSLRRALSSILGGSDTIERRLRQSGSPHNLDAFRSEQLVWALIGLAGGTVLVFSIPVIRTAPVIVPLVLPVFMGFGWRTGTGLAAPAVRSRPA